MKTFDVKQDFAYDKMSLANPQPVQGGTYFTKLRMDDEPLYLQLPKCSTKQGIVTTKKGKYCDLMYESNDEEVLITFIENLESRCQELINNKKHLWFHTELSKDDIASMMTPICRMYRSGKNVLIRVTIDTCKQTNKDKCIAYTEEEVLVDLDTLQENQKTIPLICVDGLKFSSRSFEISINLKQLMFLKKEESIEQTQTCLIKHHISSTQTVNDNASSVPVVPAVQVAPTKSLDSNYVVPSPPLEDPPPLPPIDKPTHVVENNEKKLLHANLHTVDENKQDGDENTPIINDLQKEMNDHKKDKNGIEEIELDLTDNKETINLKQPNEVYYEIYKAAKKKAKHMRQVALDAYMEAQQIKAKFSLDDLEETDDSDYYSDNSEDVSNDDIMPLNLADN